jgi:putative DNA primase/helicase
MSGVFETLREQVDIAEVARTYTQLKRVGKMMRGRCPIHQDDSPSFFIYDDGRAHCYGCQFHGDVIDLWAELKGLPRGIESALDLAHHHNVRLPDKDPDAQRKADERRRKEVDYERQAMACYQNLANHPEVKEWWQSRGFNEELQKQYLLGANREGTAATIPYWHRGRIQGLIRRQLTGEPKYLVPNADDFPGGHKPVFIPGKTSGDVHLVEGFIDALSLDALGLNAVAVGSTGISERQQTELLKLKGDFYINPDADEPGKDSSRKWVRELYPKARLCVADYGENRKDINDLFKAEGEQAKTILEELKPSSMDALDLALSEAPKGTARQSWRYAKENVLPLLIKLEDEGERSAALTDAAKKLGLKASDLQRAVKLETEEEEETNEPAKLELHDPELWPDPVDGAELLDDLVKTTKRFVSTAEGVPETVALWSLFAHSLDAFEIAPLLAINSPEKRCGKTTLLTLVNTIVPRPLQASNITPSALFRAVEKYKPTLLIDEADTFLAGNEELRGIINSGHRKVGAYVIRTVGDDHEPSLFCTWAAKAIALIGALPETLEDRSILIRMQRRKAGEQADELRIDRLGELEPLRQRAARWAADNFNRLKLADPDIPAQITNARARDNWRVLLAIADAAGGHWPERARAIALGFANAEPETESTKVLLLQDLRMIFREHGPRIESEKIVSELIDIEGHPWAEGRNGKPLTKTGLSRLLRPFNIHPGKWRDGDRTERGYQRSAFEEVFARYLDIETPQTPHATDSTTYSQNETPHDTPFVAFGNPANSNGMNDVASVAFGNGDYTEKEVPAGYEWTEIEGVPLLVKQDLPMPAGVDPDEFRERCAVIAESHQVSDQEAARIAVAEYEAMGTM